MPFVQANIKEEIEELRQTDPAFRKAWDDSREEYRLIGEMVSLRKKEKITQAQLSAITGNKQQVISRIEKHEDNPKLKTFCNLIDALGYELQIVKKASAK